MDTGRTGLFRRNHVDLLPGVHQTFAADVRYIRYRFKSSAPSRLLVTAPVRLRLLNILNDGIFPNLLQSVCSYWGGHKRTELKKISKYADSHPALIGPTAGPEQTSKNKVHRTTSQGMKVAHLNTSGTSKTQESIIVTITDI